MAPFFLPLLDVERTGGEDGGRGDAHGIGASPSAPDAVGELCKVSPPPLPCVLLPVDRPQTRIETPNVHSVISADPALYAAADKLPMRILSPLLTLADKFCGNTEPLLSPPLHVSASQEKAFQVQC